MCTHTTPAVVAAWLPGDALWVSTNFMDSKSHHFQGAVFATPDGQWPDEKHLPRISASMDSAGIKMWELYDVDQTCCDPEDAPLDITDMRPFEPLV